MTKLNQIKTALLIFFGTQLLFSQEGLTYGGVPLSGTEEIGKKKLCIFILAGQSNMAGHAKIVTFDYIGDDPKTVDILDEMVDSTGKPWTLKDTWIPYSRSDEGGDT